jgi:hypothetical protein
VYGIEGRRFEPGTEVSPELRRVVEHVVRQINAARTEAKLTAQPICPHHRRRMQQWM